MVSDSPCTLTNPHIIAVFLRLSVLRGRKDHPSVYFILEVFNRCIRLGFYEEFIELIPEEFGPLLPPEPLYKFKYSSEADRKEIVAMHSYADMKLSYFTAPLPEAEVAKKLIDAIRAKEELEQCLPRIMDSLPSVNPELSLDRNG